jgi:hypothetical protein
MLLVRQDLAFYRGVETSQKAIGISNLPLKCPRPASRHSALALFNDSCSVIDKELYI